eukprot:s660_g14.t1
MYLGRWPSVEELQRCPNPAQEAVFQRLRTFMIACGEAQEMFSLCPGRSSPELGAALFQLEKFCESSPDLVSGYMEETRKPFKEDPGLLSSEEHPELVPHRSLDSKRLRIVGTGAWPLDSFLEGVLWLPYQEPRFLFHGFPVPDNDVPNLQTEKPEECLNLAKVWDARGLLYLAEEPVQPGMFCKVFNAYKSRECDRQIGDRRLLNQAEFHVDGPSKQLPQGQQLTQLRVPRFSHMLRASVTDRRDFYHQSTVTEERSRTNMLPFSYPTEVFAGTSAFDVLVEECRSRKKDRTMGGDGFRTVLSKRSPALPEKVYPCFKSLFQGDHLGVEFALASHSVLLERGGLLASSRRILGNEVFPRGSAWEALVIDDYFVVSAEPLSCPVEEAFALRALNLARKVYDREQLVGSPEKDVVAEPTAKTAGAEIRSNPENVRRGVVPGGAPFSKRLALSVLSLRAARLPAITPKLVARLAGNWVSVLQYRKCFGSLIDDLFSLSVQCQGSEDDFVLGLPRKVGQELCLLATMSPLVFSNVAVDFLDEVFATDASNQKGAVVKAKIERDVHEEIWLGTEKKGAYTHLDNGFRATLRHLGEVDDDLDAACPLTFDTRPQKAPLMYFDFVEICGGAGKVGDSLARRGWTVAPVLDLSESRHYDLGSLRLLEWIIFMIEENRFRSFFVAPPCTSFSPAAHPAVRSYREPLGFDRLRTLILLRVGRRCHRPCGAEQSRLSKISAWTSLLDFGFAEAVLASCRFGSPHRKEFRLLCYLLDVDFLDTRCTGGHSHIRIQGSLTKPSAIYVDGLADHIATAFHFALKGLDAAENLEPDASGLESPVVNDVALCSKWEVVRSWFWKRVGHINVLELSAAVSMVESVSRDHSSVRFASLVDSAVCKGALSKGRSASRALQPGLKRMGALCISADLYPVWPFCPTRLNVADDPTRSTQIRQACRRSLVQLGGLDMRKAAGGFLRRFAANWFRLVVLVLQVGGSVGCGGEGKDPINLTERAGTENMLGFLGSFWTFTSGSAFSILFGLCLLAFVTSHGFSAFAAPWTFHNPQAWTFHQVTWTFLSGGCSRSGHGKYNPPRYASSLGFRTLFRAMVFLMVFCTGESMPLSAETAAERTRMFNRAGNFLASTRAVKQQTRDKRKIYLSRFQRWLFEEKRMSLRFLLDQKPPDPEAISAALVEYGKQLYYAGKSYGIYAETVNAVAVERPLVRRQLTSAWDLAFCWLADEPHRHHPALPLSIMAAMGTTALSWGWPYEAAVIMMSWVGIMRIGEVLCASYDLGSLRPGGATFLLHLTEDSELVRRRGRWLSTRVLEIYLQEIQVCTYLDRVTPRARALIELCAGAFAYTLERSLKTGTRRSNLKEWHELSKFRPAAEEDHKAFIAGILNNFQLMARFTRFLRQSQDFFQKAEEEYLATGRPIGPSEFLSLMAQKLHDAKISTAHL